VLGVAFWSFYALFSLTTVVAVPLLCLVVIGVPNTKKSIVFKVTVGMLVRAILESMQIRSNKPRIFIQGKNTFNGMDLWGPQ
jgi:sulfopyruvate decarboxylase TPP-binding subunit